MAYKAKKKSDLGTKIFVWFMFAAMLFSFVGSILYYLIASKQKEKNVGLVLGVLCWINSYRKESFALLFKELFYDTVYGLPVVPEPFKFAEVSGLRLMTGATAVEP